jgi:hypothetical protein
MNSLRLMLVFALFSGCDGDLRFDQPRGTTRANTDAAAADCVRDEDCGAESLHCDSVSGRCVACRDDGDCSDPSAPRCDLALHRCVGCGSDVDCGPQEICIPMTRTCTTRCQEGPSEKSCPASAPTCDEVARICVQCKSDEDCRAISDDGPYCERSSGRCVYCLDDRQCPATRPRCDRVQLRCAQCSTRDDCPAGESCDPRTLNCF